MAWPTTLSERKHARLLSCLVALGVILRLWQWLGGGSLWLDEITLTRNIVAFSVGELVTSPLAFDQVAPPGFLAAVKIATLLLGSGERALWLVPLIGGLLGLVLFRKLAERALEGIAVPFAVAVFALAVALIRYSAEVKQYGLDAAAAVALTLIALELRSRECSGRELRLAGLAGLVIILFSQASALVMAGLGGALGVMGIVERDRRALRAFFVTVPLWALASVIGVVLGERSMTPSTRAFMADFWRGGFLPRPLRFSTALPWLWERLEGVYGDPWTLRLPLAWAFALLALLGIVVLWRTRRDVAMFVVAPFLVTLLAAVAQRYPFRTRLVVFLVPGALLALAAGVGWIADQAGRLTQPAAILVAAIALAGPVAALAAAGLPARVDNYFPLYEYLRAHRRPGDAIHVSYLAFSSALYYGPRYGVNAGDYTRGACNRDDTRVYLRDLDRYRGRDRVWILTKGGPVYRVANEAMRGYLDAIAVRRDFVLIPSAVGRGPTEALTLGLYDFSDAAHLRSASSETFPVEPMPDYPKPGCREWGMDPRTALASR